MKVRNLSTVVFVATLAACSGEGINGVGVDTNNDGMPDSCSGSIPCEASQQVAGSSPETGVNDHPGGQEGSVILGMYPSAKRDLPDTTAHLLETGRIDERLNAINETVYSQGEFGGQITVGQPLVDGVTAIWGDTNHVNVGDVIQMSATFDHNALPPGGCAMLVIGDLREDGSLGAWVPGECSNDGYISATEIAEHDEHGTIRFVPLIVIQDAQGFLLKVFTGDPSAPLYVVYPEAETAYIDTVYLDGDTVHYGVKSREKTGVLCAVTTFYGDSGDIEYHWETLDWDWFPGKAKLGSHTPDIGAGRWIIKVDIQGHVDQCSGTNDPSIEWHAKAPQ